MKSKMKPAAKTPAKAAQAPKRAAKAEKSVAKKTIRGGVAAKKSKAPNAPATNAKKSAAEPVKIKPVSAARTTARKAAAVAKPRKVEVAPAESEVKRVGNAARSRARSEESAPKIAKAKV